ncbi:MAG: hypothetical protein CVV32_03955 [Methanomicrobiales archaeon HGW-Methanomicrobiales-3]|jgi:hypothetical protein|nr:MAG: hypothetical protein CVV32_03955 [Methanomicrobiales archaeon HGW-Methanomicrobiales-3]
MEFCLHTDELRAGGYKKFAAGGLQSPFPPLPDMEKEGANFLTKLLSGEILLRNGLVELMKVTPTLTMRGRPHAGTIPLYPHLFGIFHSKILCLIHNP